MPPDALACLLEPPAPGSAETDVDLARWTQEVRDAGADCRAKLEWLRALVATWPK